MPSKKRPYIPKTKGCYPCSRRRIHCDRTQPRCVKCASKGLQCTGLGLRFRFSYGRPCAEPDQSWHTSVTEHAGRGSDAAAAEEDFSISVKVDCRPAAVRRSTDGGQQPRRNENDDPWLHLYSHIEPPMPQDMPHWKRQMCHHFSRHIAVEMIAVDGAHNGWRSVVLPLAQSDELVMWAVVTVSSFHIWLNTAPQNRPPVPSLAGITGGPGYRLPDPNQMYKHVISGLHQQSDFTNCDPGRKESVLVTLLVLLVGVLVTGRSDFPMLFRMLDSAFSAMGGEQGLENRQVADFIVPQVNKFRVYAAPLLSEEQGLQLISSPDHSAQLFECLVHRLPELPQYSLTITFIRDIVQQALNIYLEQVSQSRYSSSAAAAPPTTTTTTTTYCMTSSVARIQQFMETLQAYPDGHPGEQVLIWASFLAASGCILDEHMEFFEGVFMRHYMRNGFANVLEGLAYLRKIWSRDPDERWTSVLAKAGVLVM